MLAIRAVAPHDGRERKSGSIITIASIAAKRPDAGPMSYTRVESRRVDAHEVAGADPRADRGPRERDRPGLHRDEHDDAHRENDMIQQMALTQIPLGRARPARRHRQHRAVPRERRVVLLHRRDPAPRRGLLHRVTLGPADWDRLVAEQNQLTPTDVAEIAKRLDRMDANSKVGPWTRRTLAADLASNPASSRPARAADAAWSASRTRSSSTSSSGSG